MNNRGCLIGFVGLLLATQTAAIVGLVVWIASSGTQPRDDFASLAEDAARTYCEQLSLASEEVASRLEAGGAIDQAVKDFAAFNEASRDAAFASIPEALNKIDTETEIGRTGYIAAWRELRKGFAEAAK